MRNKQTQAKTVSLILQALTKSVTKESSGDSRHYSAVSVLRNFIHNVNMTVEICIKNLPQHFLVIFYMYKLVALRLVLPSAAFSVDARF